jgi:tripartite-type tricarboxylate transporter receptor subunit TctC
MFMAVGILAAGCAPSAPQPTGTPKPAATAAPAKPAASPAGDPASKPAASPVASPAASPAAGAASVPPSSRVDPSLASLWQGKTINLVAGTAPGGGYDTWARVVARHLGKHLPGSPNIIVENMPGAGHRVAANFLYTAKNDGLTMGLVDRSLPTYQLLGEGPEQGVRYDVTKFHWIGSTTNTTQLLAIDARAGITPANIGVLEQRDIRVGHQTTGSITHQMNVILREVMGWKLKAIAGFPSNPEMVLSIERGEIDATITDSDTAKQIMTPQFQARTIIPLVQMGERKSDPLFQAAPIAKELFANKGPLAAELLEAFEPPLAWARPYFLPPGTPANVVATMRAAFMAMVADPDFIAETVQLRIDLDPLPGERVQAMIEQYMRTPRSVIDRLDRLVAEDAAE